MTRDQTFVIVGAGLAGAMAAEALRAEGFDGRVVLVGAERERPYHRPRLSKQYLRGEAGRDALYVHDDGFYAAHEVELRLGRSATGLDATISSVTVDDGVSDPIERLIRERTEVDARRLADPDAPLTVAEPVA